MMASAGGKGSGRRPDSVDRETFEKNWDAIFGKKEETKVKESNPSDADKMETNQHT